MKTIAQAQLDNAATYRCIEPRYTAMTEQAYAAGVRTNAGLGGTEPKRKEQLWDTNLRSANTTG